MPERIVTDSNGRKHITREPLLNARTYSQAELDAAVAAERERCANLCEGRAIHQNGPHVVTLEMNQMAQAIRGKHEFRA